MQVVRIPLDRIDASQRLRDVDPDFVALIANSMAERGQDTPIDVRPAGAANEEFDYILIAGGHRFGAAERLGWTEIEGKVFLGSALEAALLEIDENLCRRELSALDRATFLARRKEVYETLHPAAKHGGDRTGKQNEENFVLTRAFSDATAEKLGLSRRMVEIYVARFNRISPDVRARLATSRFADKGSELDALAKLEPAEQRAVVNHLLSGAPEAPTGVAAAVRLVRGIRPSAADAGEAQFQALVRAWGKAQDRRARRRFLDALVSENPNVFDPWLQAREDELAVDGEVPEAEANDDAPAPARGGRRAA